MGFGPVHLSRNEGWGEVERRRSGVREGEGRAWEAVCIAWTVNT